MANKFRKEVTIELDGTSLTCRPTLSKIAEIESRFGPALEILRKLGAGGMSVTDLVALVALIVKGAPGAPAPKDVPEMVFSVGAYSFAGVVSEFIANALSSDEPAPEAAEGNAA